MPTSTRVAEVMTDAGPAFLKGIGNPAGEAALASELVAGELAVLMGLRVPEFAVIELDMDIPMEGRGPMRHGPAFVSRRLEGAVGDGGDTFLRALSRPGAVARLVVFDTWVRNQDRCPPEGALDSEPNRDNLFFTPDGRKFDLVALDHSHCFVEGEMELEISQPHVRDDDRIFGLFPEFAPFIDERSVLAAVESLRQVDAASVRAIVASVPMAWGPSRQAREAWISVILARAELVAKFAPQKLLAQRRLEL